MRRRWWWHRQAYAPRLWPMMLVCVAIVLPLSLLLNWWQAGLLGFLVSTVVANGRYALWRHRHPVLPAEKIMDAQRKAAPWN